MENVNVTLPGGKSVEVRRGTRIDELPSSASADKGAIAAKIDGRAVDLERAIDADCILEWIPADSPEGLDIFATPPPI